MESTNTFAFTIAILALLLVSWMLGYISRSRAMVQRRQPPDPDYFVGLNYLLNDEPDDAIDVFIAALELNSSTFDTHLALGKLLRRRGKVDRSIEHYQSLLAARNFNSKQTAEIRLQLLRSFIAAGLLDRAEQLLLELKQTASSLRGEALTLAIMLYQIEREWRLALDAANEALKLAPAQHRHDLLMQVTHFHCELAELAAAEGNLEAAREELKLALNMFKGNIRVYVQLARIENSESKPLDALALLLKAVQVEPDFFAELLPDLCSAAERAGLDSEVWLTPELARDLKGHSALHVEIAMQKLGAEGARIAIDYLLLSLRQSPSLLLLKEVLRLAASERVMQDSVIEASSEILSLNMHFQPRYRCDNCGFELKNLHWACPGCSCWGMVRPINNLIVAGPEPGMATTMD